MKRVSVVGLVISLVLLAFLVMPALAQDPQSVEGTSWQGTFQNSCGGPPATSCMTFEAGTGIIMWDQDFGTGPTVFTGQYRELKLGPFSFWRATLLDGSPDGMFKLNGLALGTLLSTLKLDNSDVMCSNGMPLTAKGFYRKSSCVPGTGPSANDGELGIAGAP